MVNKLKVAFIVLACLIGFVGAWPSSGLFTGTGRVNITTDRVTNDNSGWNKNETILNTSNVPNLKTKATISVDDQVDAQPLIYNGSMYVATENNTIYRLDAKTGSLITSRNVGTPVPVLANTGCTNGSPNVGILSTPVIDPATNILYFMSYQYLSNIPTYKIYGVNAGTLADVITPNIVALTATLSDSSAYAFSATVTRQRPALKLANNEVYAGFGSHCDFFTSLTRGWLLGFNKSTLGLAVVNGYLVDQFNPDVNTPPFYLNSIWQSGAGPVFDTAGSIYVTTGNSGTGTAGYTEISNLVCTALKLSSSSFTVLDWMQRNNPVAACNAPLGDADTSGMGPVLLPDIPNCTQDFRGSGGPVDSCVHLLLYGSKDGCCFLVNRDDMGHTFADPMNPGSTNPKLIDSFTQLNGFYTSSYFYGSDGILRFTACQDGSFGVNAFQVNTWKLTTTFVTSTGLFQYTRTADQTLGSNITTQGGQGYQDGQDGCGLWTVSSNGMVAGTAVIWIVARPHATGHGNQNPPILYATDPLNGTQLISTGLSVWTYTNGNMNAAPVVANGRVYYCTWKVCNIFGL